MLKNLEVFRRLKGTVEGMHRSRLNAKGSCGDQVIGKVALPGCCLEGDIHFGD